MIADQFIEAAGHIKAQIETLAKAKSERLAVIADIKANLAPLEAQVSDIEKRIAGHEAALVALKSVGGSVSWGNRVRQWLGRSPVTNALGGVASAPSVNVPDMPPVATFSEVIPLGDRPKKSVRELALAERAARENG